MRITDMFSAVMSHAIHHSGKVLFLVGKGPQYKYAQYIRHILLLSQTGKSAMVADLVAYGTRGDVPIPTGYSLPEGLPTSWYEKHTWLALRNPRILWPSEHELGQFQTVEGVSVPDCFVGKTSMMYVRHSSLDDPLVK